MDRLVFILSLIFLVACGSESSREAAPEFSSNVNVNEIQYRLTELEVSGEIFFANEMEQNFRNAFMHPEALQNEDVLRKTVDNQYTLQVNGTKAEINVGSSGEFDSVKETNLDDGCRLVGKADSQGAALYDRLDLRYELRVRLDGEDCPASVREAYLRFIDKELDGLHFKVIEKLRESESIQFEGSREVVIRVRAIGVVS